MPTAMQSAASKLSPCTAGGATRQAAIGRAPEVTPLCCADSRRYCSVAWWYSQEQVPGARADWQQWVATGEQAAKGCGGATAPHTSTSFATSPSTLQHCAISSSLQQQRQQHGKMAGCPTQQATNNRHAHATLCAPPPRSAPPTRQPSPDDQRRHQPHNVALARSDHNHAPVPRRVDQRARHLRRKRRVDNGRSARGEQPCDVSSLEMCASSLPH